MDKNAVVFRLNDKEYIVLRADNLEEVHCCYDIELIFVGDGYSYMIGDGNARCSLERFAKRLAWALSGELAVPRGIAQDLGYVGNEYLYGESTNEQEDDEKFSVWEHCIFGTRGRNKLNTWLYNDKKGRIIMEVSPGYSWVLDDEGKDPDYISYEEWIKNYQPLFSVKIPKNVAKRWLDQLIPILEKIEENVKKEFSQSSVK